MIPLHRITPPRIVWGVIPVGQGGVSVKRAAAIPIKILKIDKANKRIEAQWGTLAPRWLDYHAAQAWHLRRPRGLKSAVMRRAIRTPK